MDLLAFIPSAASAPPPGTSAGAPAMPDAEMAAAFDNALAATLAIVETASTRATAPAAGELPPLTEWLLTSLIGEAGGDAITADADAAGLTAADALAADALADDVPAVIVPEIDVEEPVDAGPLPLMPAVVVMPPVVAPEMKDGEMSAGSEDPAPLVAEDPAPLVAEDPAPLVAPGETEAAAAGPGTTDRIGAGSIAVGTELPAVPADTAKADPNAAAIQPAAARRSTAPAAVSMMTSVAPATEAPAPAETAPPAAAAAEATAVAGEATAVAADSAPATHAPPAAVPARHARAAQAPATELAPVSNGSALRVNAAPAQTSEATAATAVPGAAVYAAPSISARTERVASGDVRLQADAQGVTQPDVQTVRLQDGARVIDPGTVQRQPDTRGVRPQHDASGVRIQPEAAARPSDNRSVRLQPDLALGSAVAVVPETASGHDAANGGHDQGAQGQARRSPEFLRFVAALSQVAAAGDEAARSVASPVAAPTPASAAAPVAQAPAVAPATPVPAATTPDAENIGRLVQAIRINARQGAWEATVRLKPEHLGEVTISLRVDRQAVSAVVHAEAAGVRQWLESQEQAVRSGMAEHGLQLERFVVQRDGQRRDPQPQDHDARRRPQARRQPETTERFEIVV